MLIAVVWKGGKGDPGVHRQGVTGPAQMLALSFLLKQLAEEPEPEPELVRGRGEVLTIEIPGATPFKTAPEDAVVLYRRETEDAALEFDWLAGAAPGRDQLWTASVLLDEMGRNDMRRVLAQLDAEQAQRDAMARAAMEAVSRRPNFGRRN